MASPGRTTRCPQGGDDGCGVLAWRRLKAPRITGDQSGGKLRGHTVPGARIEAVNLSAIPGVRRRPEETRVIAVADEEGRFSGALAMFDGDLIRLRARTALNRCSPWRTLRASGIGRRRARPLLATLRIALRDAGGGRVRAFSVNPSRPIGEPRLAVVFANRRLGAEKRVTLTARGNLPLNLALPGRAGDRFEVTAAGPRRSVAAAAPAATRGAAPAAGRGAAPAPARGPKLGDLRVPPRPPRGAPSAYPGETSPGRYHQAIGFAPEMRQLKGALFVGPPRPDDVIQSELPDCYLAGAATALAHARPEALLSRIRSLDAERCDVELTARDPRAPGGWRTERVVVSRAFYVRPSGHMAYGSGAPGRVREDHSPLWWPVLEKAFATRAGGYHVIGGKGRPETVFEALLACPGRQIPVTAGDDRRIWREIRAALDLGHPLAVMTAGKRSALRYRNTGLFPGHSYAIVGAHERGGLRFVRLRNPWGEHTPDEDGRHSHGYFEIELAHFLRMFAAISTIRASRSVQRPERSAAWNAASGAGRPGRLASSPSAA